MRFFSMFGPWLLIGAMAGSLAIGQDAASLASPPSLAGVTWAGPAPNPTAFEGKTVLVLTYVTWCPKCNAWSGNLAGEIKKQSVDRPLIVLAISTDTPAAEAAQYMQQRGLVGPNVFHGYDPTLATRFGFANKFFNFALVTPEGEIAATGNAGSRYGDGKEPSYVPAREIASAKDLGSFRFIKSEMSAELKNRLWFVELGISKSLGRDLKKFEKGLSPEDREQLQSAVTGFVAAEASNLEALSSSESVADQLSAIEKAKFLSAQFAASPEGRRAKELLAEMAKDEHLKQEVAAKRQYELAMKIVNPNRRTKMLELLGKKYAETEFGKQATEAATATAR